MAAVALNFNGFVTANSLLSYRELFASESALLKDKPLSQYLTEMDQQEYEIVKLENAELMTFDQAASSKTVGLGLIIFGLIATCGSIISIGTRMSINELVGYSDDTFFGDAGMGGYLIGGIGSFATGTAIMVNAAQQLKDKVNEISDNRLLRLQDKIKRLEERISAINEPSEIAQLKLAKDSFYLKHQL
jgi:hypothetical protein